MRVSFRDRKGNPLSSSSSVRLERAGSRDTSGADSAERRVRRAAVPSSTETRKPSRFGLMFFKQRKPTAASGGAGDAASIHGNDSAGDDARSERAGSDESLGKSAFDSPRTRTLQATTSSSSPSASPKVMLKAFGVRSYRESTRTKESFDLDSPQLDRQSKSFRNNEMRLSKDADDFDDSERSERFSLKRDKSSRDSKRSLLHQPKLRILFGGPSERPKFVVMTDEMIRLETLIQSDRSRQKLVQELISVKGDQVVKLRFCSAVDQFDATKGEQERAHLADALVQTFLVYGSMFHLSCLSEARVYSIVVEGQHNQFLDAKREVLEDMSRDPEVMRCVNFVESLDEHEY